MRFAFISFVACALLLPLMAANTFGACRPEGKMKVELHRIELPLEDGVAVVLYVTDTDLEHNKVTAQSVRRDAQILAEFSVEEFKWLLRTGTYEVDGIKINAAEVGEVEVTKPDRDAYIKRVTPGVLSLFENGVFFELYTNRATGPSLAYRGVTYDGTDVIQLFWKHEGVKADDE